MIFARTARIDDNLGRGTDGPSSGESGANLTFGGYPPARGQVLRPERAVVNEIVAMIAEANRLSVR